MYGRILLGALAALAATAVSAAQDEGVFVNQQPECASEPEVFVLPTTGVPFSLPQDHDAGLERCAPVPPPPVRPAAPNLFRMIAMPIGPQLRMAAFGTPAYFSERGIPQTPYDLAHHNCIGLRMASSGGIYAWEFDRNGKEIRVKTQGQLVFNDVDLIVSQRPLHFTLIE